MYYSLHRLSKNHCLVTPFKTLNSRPQYHEDVIKWKTFPRYWPFVQIINRSPVNFPHKGQWRRALMFSLICAWIIGCANTNTREARDLRRHVAYYDVILIFMSLNWVIICKVKACDQFGIIVLPKPLATEYQLDTGNHNSVKVESKYNDYMYLLWICIWKCRLQVVGHLFNVLFLPMPVSSIHTWPELFITDISRLVPKLKIRHILLQGFTWVPIIPNLHSLTALYHTKWPIKSHKISWHYLY